MSKPKGTRRSLTVGGNTLAYRRVCLWCGKEFRCAKPQAKTCQQKCRQSLNRFVAKHGHPPLFPFGANEEPSERKLAARIAAAKPAAKPQVRKGGAQ